MKNNGEVLVSVLMTAYNREKFIAHAIESVLSSTYKNFELIIVDDCSTDNTISIAQEFAAKDKRVYILKNEYNLTQFPNRNKAAVFAKGKYIKYVDSDDTIYPWSLQYCVEMMEKYPDAGMGVLYLKNEIADEYLVPERAIKKNYFQSTILNIGPGATILRTELFRKADYYTVNYGIPSDMYFNLKMANLYPVVLLKKNFFFYRTHEGQELNNRYSYLQYNYRYLKDAFNLPGFPLTAEQKKYLLRRQRFWYVRDFMVYVKNTGKIKQAIRAAVHSGMSLFNFISSLSELLLIQLKIKKNY
jgi:glycosyltransferase involved in cell wall biosynthesis